MSDSFMQDDITSKQLGWQVDTADNGTCYVPGDVQAVPAWLAPGVSVTADDGPVFDTLIALISDYVPAHEIGSLEVCSGYFARLSAPGYLDCTDWTCHSTIREARASLREDC